MIIKMSDNNTSGGEITKDNAHHYVKQLVDGFNKVQKNQDKIITHLKNLHNHVNELHKTVSALRDVMK
jgi:polyhydroxyalkanoate synthesis regulator phasin